MKSRKPQSMLKILQLGNPLLRKKSLKVSIKEIKLKHIQLVIDKIITVMKKIKKTSPSHGNGLCAPQVGHLHRIIVIYFDKKYHILINPIITKKSKKIFKSSEGCLSFFYLRGYVQRHKRIDISAYDETGKKVKYSFHENLAALVQHEIDHLNGILFIDRINDTKKIFAIEEFYKSKPKKIRIIKKIIELIT
ncbi:peptide deformylase [Patescibacteria group bacterium]